MRLNNTKIIYSALYLVSILLSACIGPGGPNPPVYLYTISGSVTGLNGSMVLQDNGGDNLTVAAGTFTFAPNATFTFATGVANGSPYSVTVLTPPQFQTCTITGGSGTATANVFTVEVNCVPPTPRFAYVANYYDNTVSIYTVNASTGQLRDNGYVTPGNGPFSVSVDPSGKFAYVANEGSNDVSAYTINASTGALTQITCKGTGCNGSNFAAGTSPRSVTVDPSGRFAYVANINFVNVRPNVSAYTINAATGALTLVGTVAGGSPASVSVDPTGKFAYVANNAGYVSAYSINASTGALTQISCVGGVTGGCNGSNFAAGTNPLSVSVDPSGKFVYVANSFNGAGGNSVSAYTIDTTTGALTLIGTVGAGTEPSSVTVDPIGKFAYVANEGSNDVSAYRINASTGALSPTGTVAAGTNPMSVTVDPSGKFAYVANSFNGTGGNSVSAYTINAFTGALTSLGTVRARSGSISIAMTKGTAPVIYTPKFAYVANIMAYYSNVSAYTINASGALSPILCVGGAVAGCTGSNFTAGSFPYSVTVDPTGQFAYVANHGANMAIDGANDVSAYTINASTGALSQILCVGGTVAGCSGNNFLAGTHPYSVTVDPSGKFAYVANYGSNDVSSYRINASTGALTSFSAPVAAGTNPQSVTVDPTGQFAYVANSFDGRGGNSVSAYRINVYGFLTKVIGSPFPAGTTPSSVTVDPSGRYAYVANFNRGNSPGGTISAYSINASTGALTPVPFGIVDAGGSPISVTVDPSGKFAYVANYYGGNVSAFSIDASTGVLKSVGTVPATTYNSTSVTVDPSGKFAYVTNPNIGPGPVGFVSQYTIGATGGLRPMTQAAVTAEASPRSVITTGTIQ
jgi:6-phosphogluconolactonase (cycloisomerase 2 family)